MSASNVIAFPVRSAPTPTTSAPASSPRAVREVQPRQAATAPAPVGDLERQSAAAALDQVLGYTGAGARVLERWGRPADVRAARGLCTRCRMHRVLGAAGRCAPCEPYDEERG